VQRYYLVPSANSAKAGEPEALEVLAHILGRGANSRLYDSLVVEKGLAVSAGAGYSSTSVDPTSFNVSGTPKPGVTLQQLEEEIDGIVAEIIAKGVTAQELERTKGRMIADAVYAQDNQSTLARWYGAALATGLTVDQVKTWPDRIKAVSADAVRDVARQYLDKRRSVTGYLVKELRPEEKRS
jgi:zinc protease